jgi:formate dehydrogenase subunit delta
MSHDEQHAMSTDQKLVYMANQIASFFASQPKHEAADGVAKHINDFWDPRMRRRFFELAETGMQDIAPLVREALPKIRRPSASSS